MNLEALFDLFVRACRLTDQPIACFMHIHELDENMVLPVAEELNTNFRSINGYGLRVYTSHRPIPGFIEIYDQHDRLMRTIRLC